MTHEAGAGSGAVSGGAGGGAGARRLLVVGLGCGRADQLTLQAVAALQAVRDSGGYAVAARKRADDPLLALRRELLAVHAPGLDLVEVPDPPRRREAAEVASVAGYESAVDDWHAARAAAYEDLLAERPGDVAFLVWGDPAFYDSTLRVVQRVRAGVRGPVRVDGVIEVVPGISSLQLLAAAHRTVLHEVGQPVLVTTGRRLPEAVRTAAADPDPGRGAGLGDNVVAMLTTGDELALWGDDVADWHVWWGANLGSPGQQLVSGTVAHVRDDIAAARTRARALDGWVMDVLLLRRPR